MDTNNLLSSLERQRVYIRLSRHCQTVYAASTDECATQARPWRKQVTCAVHPEWKHIQVVLF